MRTEILISLANPYSIRFGVTIKDSYSLHVVNRTEWLKQRILNKRTGSTNRSSPTVAALCSETAYQRSKRLEDYCLAREDVYVHLGDALDEKPVG